jgi:hypothetical protein
MVSVSVRAYVIHCYALGSWHPSAQLLFAARLQRETAWGESLELLAVHHRQNGCALEQVFGNPETFSANERQGTAKLCSSLGRKAGRLMALFCCFERKDIGGHRRPRQKPLLLSEYLFVLIGGTTPVQWLCGIEAPCNFARGRQNGV